MIHTCRSQFPIAIRPDFQTHCRPTIVPTESTIASIAPFNTAGSSDHAATIRANSASSSGPRSEPIVSRFAFSFVVTNVLKPPVYPGFLHFMWTTFGVSDLEPVLSAAHQHVGRLVSRSRWEDQSPLRRHGDLSFRRPTVRTRSCCP